MKIFNQKKGLTLTELIVATILIGIVMLGVATFLITTRQIQSSTSKITLLSIQTSAAMTRIVKRSEAATGQQTKPGIVLSSSIPPDAIAFRVDTETPYTPQNYDDDIWYIYKVVGNELYECREGEGSSTSIPLVPTFINCPTGLPNEILLDKISSYTFDFQANNTNLANLQFYAEITLNTTWNPADKTSTPVDNPTYQLSTRVSPWGHTW